MAIQIRTTAFDPWQELQVYQAEHLPAAGFGATAVFVGSLRDFNEGDAVQAMFLEHYPGMTERFLEDLRTQALQRWDILDALIIHRVGALQPADPIVLVAVWSAHRAAAFESCRQLMEDLKSRAPFWKKETLAGHVRWVEHNTPG